ncbi:hypothetical protein ABFA07_004582 [Porites harrisoni]
MAANVDFAETLRPALQRAKSDCLSKVSTGDGIKKVSDFFRELDGAVGVLEDKYKERSRHREIQQLLPSRGMVAKALRKVHIKIIRRLSSRPRLANPWLGEFTVDMPMEVMECISKHILDRTNFGHESCETNSQLYYKIIDFRKAKYLFRRMDIDGTEVDLENILQKKMNHEEERCEVIFSDEKPMELKFRKKNEVLTVKFHYGYWNMDGVPQH